MVAVDHTIKVAFLTKRDKWKGFDNSKGRKKLCNYFIISNIEEK